MMRVLLQKLINHRSNEKTTTQRHCRIGGDPFILS